jgi:hypothetical protein
MRDRALLLIGFAGALRRSELVALIKDEQQVVAQQSLGLTHPRARLMPRRVARTSSDRVGLGSPRAPEARASQNKKAGRPVHPWPPATAAMICRRTGRVFDRA